MHSKQLKKLKRYINLMLMLTFIGVGALGIPDEKAYFYFLDVGQGDASLLVMPGDIEIIIDGGPGDTVLEKIGTLLPFYDRTIELMVLTHTHKDHFEGLVEIAKRYSVTTFLYNGIDDGIEALLIELERQDTKIVRITNQSIFHLSPNVYLEVLFPDHQLSVSADVNPNEQSLITRFVYFDTSIIFSGDAPKAIERSVVSKGYRLSADIIQIGHHGSKTSTDTAFIQEIQPTFGIISVGKNNYGHPHQRTLHTLRTSGVTILSTNEIGDIVFSTDGTMLTYISP